jgi:nucleoside-diphosphate-sugar epimerase
LNYLINGTSSIVGTSIAKFIIKKKNFIYCYYNKNKPKGLTSKYSIIQKNNFQDIYKTEKKIDCLIYCAIDKTNNYNNQNLHFLKRVSVFAKTKHIKKIIYISTMAVYGIQEKVNIDEKTIPKNLSIYGKIKIQQERILQKFSKKNNCQVTVLRLPGVVGKKRTGIFMSEVLHQLKNNKVLKYKNPNAKFNNLIFENDLAKVVYAVSKNKKKYKFNIFNLGSSKPMLLNKVIKKIATKFNHNNKIYATKSDGKSFIVNIKKFERLFFKLSTTSSSLLRFILVNK